MLDFKTAGESHGKGLMAIIDGLPSGIEIDLGVINDKLARRQGAYGRGGRMKIERDRVEIFSGVRNKKTMGSPVGLLIHNRDWENWKEVMSPEAISSSELEEIIIKKDQRIRKIKKELTRPRPGHADLAGALKYNLKDIRNILERASARETAVRTAVGAFMDNFLKYFDIQIISHLLSLGRIRAEIPEGIDFYSLKARVLSSPLACFDQDTEKKMMEYIDLIKEEGDSLGGVIELRSNSLPVGLGSHTTWEKRLDGMLSQALMSIPAIKGVEIGSAFENAGKRGSEVHDEIYYSPERAYYRLSNRAGGLEGGMSNGQPLIIRLAMKPIPTLYKPLKSVDIKSKKAFAASVERSDVTAVPAAGVVAEAMVSFILSRALLEKFGGDSMEEIMNNYNNYLEMINDD